MRCCIVVKHLGRAELGMNDSPSQSPPVKRPCPDVQVSLTSLYSPLGSNSLSLPTQGFPIFFPWLLHHKTEIWEQFQESFL